MCEGSYAVAVQAESGTCLSMQYVCSERESTTMESYARIIFIENVYLSHVLWIFQCMENFQMIKLTLHQNDYGVDPNKCVPL